MMVNGTDATVRIGAWQRANGDDRFVRLPGRSGRRWSEMTGFSQVPTGPRVLFFGESAARGMLYEPTYTPATLLETHLSARAGEPVEVLDLARIGARVTHILDAAVPARELAPHAVVVFAGNNWKYELTDGSSADLRRDEARALRQDGIAGVLRLREAALADVAERFVDRICDLFLAEVPVLFVLPESNLLDWQAPTLVPILGGGAQAKWREAAVRLARARREGDGEGVLSACADLHDLDGGVSDLAHRWRARTLLDRGDVAGALRGFRRARDVRLWYDSIDPAWLPTAGVLAAKSAALRRGALVADLTELLPGHAASGIPDGSLFADWCHLTAHGLRLVAAEIGERLAPALGISAPSRPGAPALPEPEPEVEAGAQFCAAIMNSHWDQPATTLRERSEAAVRAWPGIVTAMHRYCDRRGSRAPWWTRPGLSDVANVRRFQNVLLSGRQAYDPVLAEAFAAHIGESLPVERALVPGIRTDLLDPLLLPGWRPIDWMGLLGVVRSTLMGAANSYRHYYRAHSETTRIPFLLTTPGKVDLEITARLGTAGTGSARLAVNGHVLGSVALTERWSPLHVSVDAEIVEHGCNHLEIQWDRDALEPPPLEVTAGRIEQGLTQELSLVFAEVFSVHATVSGDSVTRQGR